MNQEFELYTPSAHSEKTTSSNYPLIKIISMIFGIIAAGLFIFYAATYTTDYFAQISQYKEMGMEIPAATLNIIYFQIALTFVVGILPLIGAVLPMKYSKVAILLISSTICWGTINTLPSVIISIIQKLTFTEMLSVLVICAAGLFSLVSAILLVVAPCYRKPCAVEDSSLTYIPEDLEDEDYSENDSEEEIIIEETVEEASDTNETEEN